MGKNVSKQMQELVAKTLPGWKVATKQVVNDAARIKIDMAKINPGVTLAELRKKFLGSDDALADAAEYYPPSPGVDTVLVEPEDGGESKVADIDLEGGNAKIVQG